MIDIVNVISISPSDVELARQGLEKIRLSQVSESELSKILSSSVEQFNLFYKSYGRPTFTANRLLRSDSPLSNLYNENLITLNKDFNRIYQSLSAASNDTLNAFNFASVISKEISSQASSVSSKVLDLNILNGYNKGEVIVAGDNFLDLSKIDQTYGIDLLQAEIIFGTGAIGLKKVDAVTVTTPATKVTISPIKPVNKNDKVNTASTPGNLERFYEGKYYALIGQQNPEGKVLKLKEVIDPANIPNSASTTTVNGGQSVDNAGGAAAALDATTSKGFFAVVSTTEEQKNSVRKNMFDGSADTYWECEIVYKVEPLIDPQDASDVLIDGGDI